MVGEASVAGSDIRAKSNDGRTPLHWALRYDAVRDVVSALVEPGAAGNLTALQLAAWQGDAAAVISLLAEGTDPNLMDGYGWSVLHFVLPPAGLDVIATGYGSGETGSYRVRVEVLLSVTWSVAEGVVARGSEGDFDPRDGPIGTGRASPKGCWRRSPTILGSTCGIPDGRRGLARTGAGSVQRASPRAEERSPWSWDDGSSTETGLLQGGRPEGFDVITWLNGDGSEGFYRNGERHGTRTIFRPEGRDDSVVREVGPYVNGALHGTWTGYDPSGNVVGTLRFENGRQVGGSGSALEADVVATVTPRKCASALCEHASPLDDFHQRIIIERSKTSRNLTCWKERP